MAGNVADADEGDLTAIIDGINQLRVQLMLIREQLNHLHQRLDTLQDLISKPRGAADTEKP